MKGIHQGGRQAIAGPEIESAAVVLECNQPCLALQHIHGCLQNQAQHRAQIQTRDHGASDTQ